MQIQPACVPCIFDDLEGALRLLVDDPAVAHRVMEQALSLLAEDYSRHEVPSYYITEVHRALKRITHIDLPFADLRRKANDVGIEIAQRLVLPSDPQERFADLVRWAIAGNCLDFRTVGTGYDMSIETMHRLLAEHVARGLHIDHTGEILTAVKDARRVLYVLDNVGEIAFDKLLIQELQTYAPVVATVRGGPITSDATMDDAVQIGLDAVVPLILAGPDTLGISLTEMSDQLRRELDRADLVITKGQANYYVMDEYRHRAPQKIACLFTTKCDLVSAHFGLTGKVNIAALLS